MAEWNNRKSLLVGLGAACAAGVGYLLSRQLIGGSDDEPHAPALSGSGAYGAVGLGALRAWTYRRKRRSNRSDTAALGKGRDTRSAKDAGKRDAALT